MEILRKRSGGFFLVGWFSFVSFVFLTLTYSSSGLIHEHDGLRQIFCFYKNSELHFILILLTQVK